MVQSRRGTAAALRLMRRLLRNHSAPEQIVTVGLRSYGSALRELGLEKRHRPGLLCENNSAENCHLPIRRRVRKMQRFRSPASAQRFLATHAAVYNSFHTARHLTSRATLRTMRGEAARAWSAAVAAA